MPSQGGGGDRSQFSRSNPQYYTAPRSSGRLYGTDEFTRQQPAQSSYAYDDAGYGMPDDGYGQTQQSYGYAGYDSTQQQAAVGFNKAASSHFASLQPPEPPRKKKGSKGMLVLAILLLVVGLVTIGIAAYMYMNTQAEYEVGNQEYASLVEEAVEQDQVSGTPTVDFAALTSQNPEIVGWVQIPDTPVNYPVAQHSDNDWYLEHTFLGQYNLAGSVFMDCRSSSALTDRVTVVYGHHLKNGAMFARVADYSDQAEFDTVREVYYVTADGTLHTLQPLCSLVVSGYDTDVLQFDFADDASFQAYVESLISRSSASVAGATSAGVSHIYILSTCSYATDNERTMLVCVERDNSVLSQDQTYQQVAGIQSAADEAAGVSNDGEA